MSYTQDLAKRLPQEGAHYKHLQAVIREEAERPAKTLRFGAKRAEKKKKVEESRRWGCVQRRERETRRAATGCGGP